MTYLLAYLLMQLPLGILLGKFMRVGSSRLTSDAFRRSQLPLGMALGGKYMRAGR